MEGALERHRGRERFMDEGRPGLHKGDHADDRDIKQRARRQGEHDGAKVSPGAKLRARLLGAFGDGLKSGHEVRNNLQHQQYRNQTPMTEKGKEVVRGAALKAECTEEKEQS